MLNFRVTQQPSAEPVTLAEAKAFISELNSDNDTLITSLITAARQAAEEYTRRKLISTQITLYLDRFPQSRGDLWWDGVRQGSRRELDGNGSQIPLPFGEVISVTSLKTYNDADVATTFDAAKYRVDRNGYITLKDGQVWPSDIRNHDGIEVIYNVGYGANASDVPEAIKLAIKAMVSAWYNDRECTDIPKAASGMLDKYRIYGDYDHALQ
jgi:hypothetical protein